MHSYLKKIENLLGELDPTAITALDEISTTREFKKGSYLLRKGEICRKSYWIEKGIARKFYFEKDKEITTEIYFDKDIAVSLAGYCLQAPSKEYIEALTDISAVQTDYSSFQQAKKLHSQLAELDFMLTEYYALWLEQRLWQLRTQNAKERYHWLLLNHPQYLQQISLTVIASYLDVSLETLSRIRARIKNDPFI
jgi:CRP-like cAMP-binding protein